jgi:hypothetical protein
MVWQGSVLDAAAGTARRQNGRREAERMQRFYEARLNRSIDPHRLGIVEVSWYPELLEERDGCMQGEIYILTSTWTRPRSMKALPSIKRGEGNHHMGTSSPSKVSETWISDRSLVEREKKRKRGDSPFSQSSPPCLDSGRSGRSRCPLEEIATRACRRRGVEPRR